MAFPAMTPLVAGSTMTWGDIESNFTAARGYLNAVPAADVAAGSISREMLPRPTIAPFPTEGMRSGFQSLHRRRLQSGNPYGTGSFGVNPRRISIVVDACDLSANRKWITPIGASLWLPGGDTLVHLTADLQVRADNTGVDYPSNAAGALARIRAGYVELVHVNRGAGTEVIRTESRRHVYPRSVAGVAGANLNALSMVASFDAGDAGDHDIYLQFVREVIADSLIIQLDFANISLTVTSFGE